MSPSHTGAMVPLPIDHLLDELVATCAAHGRLVVEAPAGAGKTTRIPPALWRARLWVGEIWVAEPRRLAASLMARRVAAEQGVRLGAQVGYTVRFDDCSSQSTRVRYVTSGILLRRLLSDPDLSGVDCVVLDEFHERHLDTDLALALLCRVQERRPNLRLLVMSATLDGARIAELLGGCPRLKSEGRLYPVELEHDTTTDERPLEKRVSSALRRQLQDDPTGSVLVFLPGAAEIRRAQSTISALCEQSHVDVRVLHGDLTLDAQNAAIQLGCRPRVVLTTNLAESSITVEGITAVIDSGLSRQLDCSAFTGVSRLTVQKVSRASAIQRAGRAARTGPGRVIRLYTKGDFEARPEFELPEILRVDFSEALLLLSGFDGIAPVGIRHTDLAPNDHPPTATAPPTNQTSITTDQLVLLDRPSRAAFESASSLLRQLGAVDERHCLTPIGRKMLTLPIHPRLARLVVECERRGIADLGALVAALLSERDLRLDSRTVLAQGGRAFAQVFSGDSDVVELVERYQYCRDARFSHHEMRDEGIDPASYRSVQHLHQQLRQAIGCHESQLELNQSVETSLANALLIAFPDRVARRRGPESRDMVLRSGAAARLSDASVVSKSEWLLAIDAEERREKGRSPGTVVRLASAISVDWLVDSLSESLQDEEELCWTDPPGRVESRSRIRLGSLVVEESRRPAKPGPKVVALLKSVIDQSGLLSCDQVTQLRTRLSFIADALRHRNVSVGADAIIDSVVDELLASRIDLAGLDSATLASNLVAELPPVVVDLLRRLAPEAVTLAHGRRCQVHYDPGRPPWIASRLQDFFGQSSVPTILDGRQKLVVQLLAPNQRAVQITDDLQGFWVNHYAEIRRQLIRRYPRHAWPEDGLSARPPDPKSRAVRRDS